MTFAPPAFPPLQVDWMRVAGRFDNFVGELRISPAQAIDGQTKHRGVRKALNAAYWGVDSETANSMLIGSWGKSTQIRPPRDVDVLFQLPDEVYYQFEERAWNRQSQLLQEVKEVLEETYPQTEISTDGQVVVVPFESYGVEVLPAFLLQGGGFWLCDTNDGGSYRKGDPVAEQADIDFVDGVTKGNARRLIRMLKRWQDHCNVPMKSFWIEIASTVFLRQWPYCTKGSVYHDWVIRDFFGFLIKYGGGFVRLPNMPEWQPIGWNWWSRAKSAYDRASKACALESDNRFYAAEAEWQKIFGPEFTA